MKGFLLRYAVGLIAYLPAVGFMGLAFFMYTCAREMPLWVFKLYLLAMPWPVGSAAICLARAMEEKC